MSGKTEVKSESESEDSKRVLKAVQISENRSPRNEKIKKLVEMGYPEEDVKRALLAGFDNPKRAIEYLTNGIPKSPSTPEGNTSDSDASSVEVTPYEFFRTNPICRRLRNTIMRNPDFLMAGVQRMGNQNMEMLRYLCENREEFVNMLFEASDDDNDEGENDDDDDDNGDGDESNEDNKENETKAELKGEVKSEADL